MQFKSGDIVILKNYIRKYICIIDQFKNNIYYFMIIDSRYPEMQGHFHFDALSARHEFKLLLPSIS